MLIKINNRYFIFIWCYIWNKTDIATFCHGLFYNTHYTLVLSFVRWVNLNGENNAGSHHLVTYKYALKFHFKSAICSDKPVINIQERVIDIQTHDCYASDVVFSVQIIISTSNPVGLVFEGLGRKKAGAH